MTLRQSGYTLLEMSIVMAVFGLIVGGVFVGRDMINNAELKSILSEVEYYQEATALFKQKYSALPGDYSKATIIWGKKPNCTLAPDADQHTCDGDGNGVINTTTENIYIWQHLSNAAFIKGVFTGAKTGPSSTILVGKDVPASQKSGIGYFLTYGSADLVCTSGTSCATTSGGGFILSVGRQHTADSPAPSLLFNGDALTPSDAFNMDQKIDDGRPLSGSVAYSVALSTATMNVDKPTGFGQCYLTSTSPYSYNVALKNPACGLDFLATKAGF